jgi:hypothetical protein
MASLKSTPLTQTVWLQSTLLTWHGLALFNSFDTMRLGFIQHATNDDASTAEELQNAAATKEVQRDQAGIWRLYPCAVALSPWLFGCQWTKEW